MLPFENIYPIIYVAIILALTYLATKIVTLFIRGIFRSGIPIIAVHVEKVVIVAIWVRCPDRCSDGWCKDRSYPSTICTSRLRRNPSLQRRFAEHGSQILQRTLHPI